MADALQVALRIRPMARNDGAPACITAVPGIPQVQIVNAQSTEYFSFDYVADQDVSQQEMYTSIAETVVSGCLEGYNGTIFAYGQTGSGKTYTMMGPSTEGHHRGLIPRAFEHLYQAMRLREQEYTDGTLEYLCKASFFEIYNENVFDLLDVSDPKTESKSLVVREDFKRGVYVEQLTEEVCDTAAACVRVLLQGVAKRKHAETLMNHQSSRSHAVFCLDVESKHTSPEQFVSYRSARLSLVDLAGSERNKDSGAVGKQMKEGCHINKSLSALGLVINALVEISQGKARHVPFRDSKLTFLLRDSLGGNSRTTIIATVHPNIPGEGMTTLKFAQRAKSVKNKPVINAEMSNDVQVLKKEIYRLRRQLRARQVPTVAPSMPTSSNCVVPPESSASTFAAPLDAMECADGPDEKLRHVEGLLVLEGAARERLEAEAVTLSGQLHCLHRCYQWTRDGCPPAMFVQIAAVFQDCVESEAPSLAPALDWQGRGLRSELARWRAGPVAKQLQDLRRTLETVQQANSSLHARQQSASDEMRRVTVENERLQAEAAQSAASASEEMRRVAFEYQRLQAEAADLRNDNTAVRHDFQRQTARTDQLVELNASLQSQNERLAHTLAAAEKDHKSLIAEAEAQRTLHDEKMKELTAEKVLALQMLQDQLDVKQSLAETLKAENARLADQLHKEEARRQDVESHLENQLCNMRAERDMLADQTSKLQASLEEALNGAKESRTSLENLVNTERSQAAEHKARAGALNEELRNARRERAALQSVAENQEMELRAEQLKQQKGKQLAEKERRIFRPIPHRRQKLRAPDERLSSSSSSTAAPVPLPVSLTRENRDCVQADDVSGRMTQAASDFADVATGHAVPLQHPSQEGQRVEASSSSHNQDELVESLKQKLAAEIESNQAKSAQLLQEHQLHVSLQEANAMLQQKVSELSKVKNTNTKIQMFERSLMENTQLKQDNTKLQEKIKQLELRCVQDKENLPLNPTANAKRRRKW